MSTSHMSSNIVYICPSLAPCPPPPSQAATTLEMRVTHLEYLLAATGDDLRRQREAVANLQMQRALMRAESEAAAARASAQQQEVEAKQQLMDLEVESVRQQAAKEVHEVSQQLGQVARERDELVDRLEAASAELEAAQKALVELEGRVLDLEERDQVCLCAVRDRERVSRVRAAAMTSTAAYHYVCTPFLEM